VRLLAGEKIDEAGEAERLSLCEEQDSLAAAELWQELRKPELAIEHATRTYLWALRQAPYIPHHYLSRATAILESFDAELPACTVVGHSSGRAFRWEDDVRSLIGRLHSISTQ
jgi:hypothetical protein